MEVAGLGVGVVGLVGLVSACLDVLDKIDTYKTFSSDSNSLALCFEADKQRFRRWLKAVGIVDGRLTDDHDPHLDDPAVKPLVLKILSQVCGLWGAGGATMSAMEMEAIDIAETLPHGGAGMSAMQKPPKSKMSVLASKRIKVGWALGGKAKFINQLDSFEALVNRLHSLVPPSEPRGSTSGDAEIGLKTEKDQQEDAALTENRRLMSELRNFLRLEGQRAVQKWLGAVTITNHHFDKCLSSRLANTCNWIFEKPTFLDWASPDFPGNNAKVLWINAPAGYGKTILCANIIEHLTAPGPTPSPTPPSPAPSTSLPSKLAYFFFSSDLESRGDPLTILRSWIAQLVAANQDALDAALSYVPANEAGTATPREIWELFAALVRALPLCTFVLDGLDECPLSGDATSGGDADRFSSDNRRARFLQDVKKTVAHTPSRVLVVSRDELDIRLEMRPVDSGSDDSENDETGADGRGDDDKRSKSAVTASDEGVALSEWRISSADVRSDVGLYARSVVEQQLPKRDAALREDLAAQMTNKCDGMFLWVRLQQKRLRGSLNRKRLLEAVQQMPPGLDHLYDRNWREICKLEGHDRCRAMAILRWTLFALRPLTVAEITEALVVVDDDDCDDISDDELPEDVNDEYVEKEIVDICQSLVEVRSEGQSDRPVGSQTLHLVHFSVRQYLMSVTLPPGLFAIDQVPFSEGDAQHSYLARVCLRYLLIERVWESGRESAFRAYAAFAWYRHGKPATSDDEAFTGLVNRLFDARYPFWDRWQDYRQIPVERNIGSQEQELELRGSPLYFASVLGMLEKVRNLCPPLAADLDDASGCLGTPLQGAAAHGNLAVVWYLLDRGADVNAVGGPFGSALNAAAARDNEDVVQFLLERGADVALEDPEQRTALFLASREGYTRIAGLLLDSGCSVEKTSSKGVTPLHVAVANGGRAMPELLLERGAHLAIADDEGWTPLHWAAMNNNTEAAAALLERGADLAAVDTCGCTPLYFAARDGHIETVKILLKHGADPAAASSDGTNSLHCSSSQGHVETVKVLLERGADVFTASRSGATPLFLAAANGRIEVVNVLLKQGADLTAADISGLTPLHVAATDNHVEVVKVLLQHGACHAVAAKDGWTSLHLAANNGNIEAAKILLDSWANLAAVTNKGLTPLHVAAAKGHFELAKLFLGRAADCSAATDIGITPLHYAASGGNAQMVKLLLKQGADLALVDKTGWTALHWAARGGHSEVVQGLLEHGASLVVARKDGETPLHLAAHEGHADVVRVFLEHGVGSSAVYKMAISPLHVAVRNGRIGVIKLLVKHGAGLAVADEAGWTPLHWAASDGNAEVVKILLELGADLTSATHSRLTPFHLAASMGHAEVVEVLLGSGVDQAVADFDGWTSYHLAADAGHEEVVKVFLERGADVAEATNEGLTALHLAARKGHIEVIKLCLERGADPATTDGTGWTPLSVAASRGHIEAVRVLLERGAGLAAAGDDGFAPLHLAAYNGKTDVVELLLAHKADIDALSRIDGTALHLAFHQRHTGCVKVLMSHGASPLIPDAFGRTVLDWAQIQRRTDDAGIPLARISDREWDQVEDQRGLQRAVIHLARDLLSAPRSQPHGIYVLAYALLYLGDVSRARFAYEERLSISGAQISCSSCNKAIEDSAHMCTVCFDMDFCDTCFGTEYDRSKLGPCKDHDMLGVKRPAGKIDGPTSNRPTMKEWLDQLLLEYSEDE